MSVLCLTSSKVISLFRIAAQDCTPDQGAPLSYRILTGNLFVYVLQRLEWCRRAANFNQLLRNRPTAQPCSCGGVTTATTPCARVDVSVGPSARARGRIRRCIGRVRGLWLRVIADANRGCFALSSSACWRPRVGELLCSSLAHAADIRGGKNILHMNRCGPAVSKTPRPKTSAVQMGLKLGLHQLQSPWKVSEKHYKASDKFRGDWNTHTTVT